MPETFWLQFMNIWKEKKEIKVERRTENNWQLEFLVSSETSQLSPQQTDYIVCIVAESQELSVVFSFFMFVIITIVLICHGVIPQSVLHMTSPHFFLL